MALTALAAGLVIKGDDKVSPVLAKVGRNFGTLQRKGKQLAKGFGQIARGVGQLANRIGIGLGIAMGVGTHKAAAFEEQVSVVKSVLQVSAEETDPLILKMKQLGATTVFSATQAAQGAEFLSRAGFSAREQLAALEGTLNAAAAEAIPLGTAANIVANNIRAFGMDASEASHVADVLALTAAKTNTNMIQLGEAMKFAAPEAKALGINVDETAQVLGLLANAGLQGTIGGTAFKNMLIKLGRPSDAVKKRLNELGIAFQNSKGDMMPITTVIKNIAKGTDKLQGNLAKTAFLTEFLGIRGKAAAQVLNQMTVAGKDGVVPMDKLAKAFEKVEGSAEKMANIRLENFRGAMTLLGSALEGLSIELFTGQLGHMEQGVRFVTDALSTVVIGLQSTEKILAGGTTPELDKLREKLGPIADSLLEISFGIREGMKVLGQLMTRVQGVADRLGIAFGENSENTRGIAKWIVILSPLLVAFTALAGAAMLFLGPLAAIGAGMMTVVKAGAVLGVALVGAFKVVQMSLFHTQMKGMNMSDRMSAAFESLKIFVKDFVRGFMLGFGGLKSSFGALQQAGAEFLGAFAPIFEMLGLQFFSTAQSGMSFGTTIVAIMSAIIETLGRVMKFVAKVAAFIIEHFINPFLAGAGQILGGFMDMLTGATSFGDAVMRIFKGIGLFIVSTFLKPIGIGMDMLVSMSKMAGMNQNGAAVLGAKELRDLIQGDPGSFLGADRKNQEGVLDERVKKTLAEKAEAEKRAKMSAMVEQNKSEKQITLEQGDTKFEAAIKTDMCVDGKALNVASSTAKVDLADRTGGVINPQRAGQIAFNGDVPAETR